LGFWDGVAITIGIIIGSGIFLTGPGICAQFTSPLPVVFVWVLGGVLATLGGLTYAEIACMRPKTGGQYVYILEGFGRPTAFVLGWSNILIGPAGLGALGVGFATFFVQLFKLDWNIPAVGVATLLLLTVLNIVGTSRASFVMKVFTALKVLALVSLIVAGLVFGGGSLSNFSEMTAFAAKDGNLSKGLALAIFPVIFSYGGWDSVTVVAGEVREPQRIIPRIILGSIAIVLAIYLLANLLYIYALGIDKVGVSANVAGDSARVFVGDTFAQLITIGIMCSIFGTVNGSVLTGARSIYAQAQSGLTFRFFGAKHPKYETPIAALLWNGIGGSAFIIAYPSFFDLLGYTTFAGQLFMGLAAASIFVYRRRGLESPYRTPLYPWVPIAYIAVTGGVIANCTYSCLMESSIILGVLLVGYPAYWIWRRFTGTRVDDLTGVVAPGDRII
jgi:APA family basic amino acid/polyamine antiporter